MRMLIKKLLKKHKYPPEGMDDALQTVMAQCELWTDNVMDAEPEQKPYEIITHSHMAKNEESLKIAEEPTPYGDH